MCGAPPDSMRGSAGSSALSASRLSGTNKISRESALSVIPPRASRPSALFASTPARSGVAHIKNCRDYVSAFALLARLNILRANGGVAEWLKAHAWKVCIRETVSRVRIPPPPPGYCFKTGNSPCERRKTLLFPKGLRFPTEPLRLPHGAESGLRRPSVSFPANLRRFGSVGNCRLFSAS